MATGKKYLSTEVSVHKLELEFVDRFLDFDESVRELCYYLDHLPESMRPEAQKQKHQILKRFFNVMQAARLARPQIKRTNGV